MTEGPNGRHTNGRWVKGYCPNPNGRRGKKPKERLDRSDLQVFGNTLIEVSANGQREEMTRREALLLKTFERAMAGNPTALRLMLSAFEKNAMQLAECRVRYDSLLIEWIIENPRFSDPHFEIPIAVEQEMAMLRTMLHFYYPEDYPCRGRDEDPDRPDEE